MPTIDLKRLAAASVAAVTCCVVATSAFSDEGLTKRNKALVRDFYTTVLVQRNIDAAFLASAKYDAGASDYKRELLNVIGEDDMVVIYVRQEWTSRDGKHHQALGFDMFRVQDGKIAEHWDADD